MNVGKLIAELSKYNQFLEVSIEGCPGIDIVEYENDDGTSYIDIQFGPVED